MAAPAKSSRWGSFLQQAVAGVEARLDTILAEGENGPNQPQAQSSQHITTPMNELQQQIGLPRSSTGNRINDRLQERLAMAMTAKSALSSETRSNASASHSARPSADGSRPGVITPPSEPFSASDSMLSALAASGLRQTPNTTSTFETTISDKTHTELALAQPSRNSQQTPTSISDPAKSDPEISDKNDPTANSFGLFLPGSCNSGTWDDAGPVCSQCIVFKAHIQALDGQTKQAAKEQQEEIHRYVEQFEALQAKLQFLARDATDAARKSVAVAPDGSWERKLAERDEQIALLMEEGQSLAFTEQKHRFMIRKLRSQITEDEKTLGSIRIHYNKAKDEMDTIRARANRVEELERSNQELKIKSNGMQDELKALRAEAAADKNTINELLDNLRKATDQDSVAVAKAKENALMAEKRRAEDLENTIAALQVENSLLVERSKISAAEAEEKVACAADRTRVMQFEMKAELQAMEGKLEAMRVLAEEASSSAEGDSKAKLLRQVETMQTQHAIATENWQGIEASLLARVGNLERERDDALRRESEMRKKARETATRCRAQDEELQELRNKVSKQQQHIDTYQTLVDALQKRVDDAEAASSQAGFDVEKKQNASERRPWLEDHLVGSTSRIQRRPDSPLLSIPARTLSNDLLMLQGDSGKCRKTSNPTSATDGLLEDSSGRRLSNQPPMRPSVLAGVSSLPSGMSTTSFLSFDIAPESLPTPTSRVDEKVGLFDGVDTMSSPRQVMQDMMSASTVAAGPSVQLVERMSAAVRRLEAEKVTSREELARICSQRDEARAEIVALMKDSESGKVASKRVVELESQVEDLHSRYQTTLELLGEKSELVDELRADVQDVKAMYRDLVERTVG